MWIACWHVSRRDTKWKSTRRPNNISKLILTGTMTRMKYSCLWKIGSNKQVGGSDCTWIGSPVISKSVSITGIDNHQLNNIPIGTVGALCNSNRVDTQDYGIDQVVCFFVYISTVFHVLILQGCCGSTKIVPLFCTYEYWDLCLGQSFSWQFIAILLLIW